jgi:AraC-like DNA-binding protein
MSPRSAVSTILTLYERQRVDALSVGRIEALHRDTIHEVIRDVRERRAGAVVVSVARCRLDDARHVARMVREYPSVRTVALLTDASAQAPHAVLSLGQSGVRDLIDARLPEGWHALREALAYEQRDEIQGIALARVASDLAAAGLEARSVPSAAVGPGEPTRNSSRPVSEAWRFFDTLFSLPSSVTTVTELAQSCGASLTTFVSRFRRIRLPQPKRYLDMARLIRVARLFENRSFTLRHVAYALHYSSPQALARSIGVVLSLRSTAFRERFDGTGMVELFRQQLVLPYLDALRRFPPVPRR